MRILLVDDDESLRTIVGRMLASDGHAVRTAADGRTAIALHRQQPSDVVITDIVMPGMEGLETIQELRRFDPTVRVIAMSGRDPLYLKLAQRLGALAVLCKPFRLEELRTCVRSVGIDVAGSDPQALPPSGDPAHGPGPEAAVESHCYRLTFQGGRMYCVDISLPPFGWTGRRHAQAVLYAIEDGTREATRLLRSDGSPVTIVAATEGAALAIASQVLSDMCDAPLESVIQCAEPPGSH
jgi:CheY-like chemotaxis protein